MHTFFVWCLIIVVMICIVLFVSYNNYFEYFEAGDDLENVELLSGIIKILKERRSKIPSIKEVLKHYKRINNGEYEIDDLKMEVENFNTQKKENESDSDEDENEIPTNESKSLAELSKERNFNELKIACDRGKLSKKYEKNNSACSDTQCGEGIELAQPALIGTLLDDAKNTQIGSIMPKFSFQEFH